MRTTIDLPDSLFRQVKARAALDGLKLKELITLFVEDGLRSGTPAAAGETAPRRGTPPVIIPATGERVPLLTNAEVEEILAREEAEGCRTSWM